MINGRSVAALWILALGVLGLGFAPRQHSNPNLTASSAAPLASGLPTLAPAPSRVFVSNPKPEFRPTGGPYITAERATQNAVARAGLGSPTKQTATQSIARQAVALMTYGDVVNWNGGSRTYRIDLAREVYLVVLSTSYVPKYAPGAQAECHWVAVVIDATDGTARELICGLTVWPAALPPQFGSALP